MGGIWWDVCTHEILNTPHVYAVNERSSYQGNGYGDAKVMSTCVSSSLSFSREI